MLSCVEHEILFVTSGPEFLFEITGVEKNIKS